MSAAVRARPCWYPTTAVCSFMGNTSSNWKAARSCSRPLLVRQFGPRIAVPVNAAALLRKQNGREGAWPESLAYWAFNAILGTQCLAVLVHRAVIIAGIAHCATFTTQTVLNRLFTISPRRFRL